MYCIAVGKPAANVTWIKVSDNRNVTFPLNIRGEEDEGAYRCITDNGVGNSVTKDVFITVLGKFNCFASLLRSALCVVSLINNVSYTQVDGVHINQLLKAKFVFTLVLHWSLGVDWLDPSLRPKFHAMGKMGKNAKERPSDGASN